MSYGGSLAMEHATSLPSRPAGAPLDQAHVAFQAPGQTVLFVSISGWLGGPGRSLASLLAGLPKVHRVVAAPENGDLLPLLRERGLAEAYIPIPWSFGPYRAKEAARAVAMVQVARWIGRHRGDLAAIHANGFTPFHLAAPGALLYRIPLVGWFHGYAVERWDRRLARLWRLVLPRTALVAVSDTARDIVVDTGLAGHQEILIIPNPIDPSDVWMGPPPGGGDGLMTVGYLGSTIPDKGFFLLPDVIEAAAALPLHWLIFTARDIRTPEEQATWARLDGLVSAPPGRSRVSWVGRVTKVAEAYGRCDAILCPSLRESFSRITAEALANGVPVVASDLAPLRDLLGEEDGGLLFPVGDVQAAAAALARLAGDAALRADLGTRGRARVAHLEVTRIAARFASLYGVGDPSPPEAGAGAWARGHPSCPRPAGQP